MADVERVDVVVVGSANLDLVGRAGRLPGPGETVHGRDFQELPGGKGLNQAVAAARAGARVAFVGAVGDDDAGAQLRALLAAEGVDVRGLVTIDGVPTGRALVAVDDRGENSIVVVAGANAHVTVDELPGAPVVMAQLEIGADAVLAAMRVGRDAGATTILNPAPADRLPAGLLELCDVVVPNEHEVAVLGGVEALLAAGVDQVVVTRGAAGADLVTASATTHVDPFAVDAVDTTGAGDAFCGALAARLATGVELRHALRFAAAAGALATTRPGAAPSFPRRAEIDGRLEQDPGTGAAAVARAYLAALSSGEPDRVTALVTDDFVNDHASALGSGCVGRDEYRRRLPRFMASLPGLDYEVERTVVEGPWVTAAYRLRATSGGHPVDVRGVMVMETRGGLVARRTDYWDALTFLRQTDQDPTAG